MTRRIKTELVIERVNRSAAARKRWEKFGQERGKPPGPDVATTTVGEQVFLKLSLGEAQKETVQDDEDKIREKLKDKTILCRICKGNHFTTKCPYKDTLKPQDEVSTPTEETKEEGGRYIAPALRFGGDKKGDRERRDESTLRITNLSEDTRESDVHELFRPYGQISRVFLARDRETNQCKGFAFVSFAMREDAARALEAVDGHGYDNLILRVEWAKSSQ